MSRGVRPVPIIRYLPDYDGVEFKFDGEHFIINSFPTMIGRLETADMFSDMSDESKLPTVRQALMVRRFLLDINREFKRVGGFPIEKECILWTDNYMMKDSPLHVEEGVVVPMNGGKPYISGYGRHEFRLVLNMNLI
jgi:hypothetical protein